MIDNQKLKLILASNSQARKALLSGAGIAFIINAANINEDIIKNQNQKSGISPAQTAQDLADAKALAVSKNIPPVNRSDLILASDQICHLAGEILNKPARKDRLHQHIERLSGKTHILTSAISIVQNGKIIFQYKEDAHLTMHKLSQADIKDYVARAVDDVVDAAGGYHLESIGVQLFEKIEGSYFTILGLPLLPLMAFLAQHQHTNLKQGEL